MTPPSLPPPPRQVTLPAWRQDPIRFTWLVAGWIVAAVALLQAGLFLYMGEWWVDTTLDTEVVTTRARITGQVIERSERHGKRNPTVFQYEFEVEVGGQRRTIRGQSKTFHPNQVAVDSQSTALVEYHPDRPRWNRLESTRHSLMPEWLMLIPALLLGMAALFLRSAHAGRTRLRHLLEHGEEQEGTVVSVRRSLAQRSGAKQERPRRVTFSYTGPDGCEHRGSTLTGQLERADALEEGDRIPILVDPLHPRRAVAYRLEPRAEIH
jgi:hypothetical protein